MKIDENSKVKMYVKPSCSYCVKAEILLAERGAQVQMLDANDVPEDFAKIKAETGCRTVPQIFIDGHYVGGCDDLEQLLNELEVHNSLDVK